MLRGLGVHVSAPFDERARRLRQGFLGLGRGLEPRRAEHRAVERQGAASCAAQGGGCLLLPLALVFFRGSGGGGEDEKRRALERKAEARAAAAAEEVEVERRQSDTSIIGIDASPSLAGISFPFFLSLESPCPFFVSGRDSDDYSLLACARQRLNALRRLEVRNEALREIIEEK